MGNSWEKPWENHRKFIGNSWEIHGKNHWQIIGKSTTNCRPSSLGTSSNYGKHLQTMWFPEGKITFTKAMTMTIVPIVQQLVRQFYPVFIYQVIANLRYPDLLRRIQLLLG
jgi:hypothetical protein